jgi:hypothetical protein
MRNVIVSLLVAAAAFACAKAETNDFTVVARFSIEAFRAAEAAMPEIVGRFEQYEGYEFTVVETDTEFIVMFSLPLEPGERGSPGGKPGVEVYLEKPTLRVVRTHLMR